MTREFDATDWHVAANGVTNPWFVTRTIPVTDKGLRSEYLMTEKGHMRRFKTREAAQKMADKMRVTADFDASREHARLAVHYMLRATDGVKPNNSILPVLERMTDLYLELTGRTL